MIETVGVEMINTSAVPLYLPSGTVIAVAQKADSLIENVIEDPWADIIRTQDGDTGPSNVAYTGTLLAMTVERKKIIWRGGTSYAMAKPRMRARQIRR